MKRSFAASLTVHALLLALMLVMSGAGNGNGDTSGGGSGNGSEDTINGQIIEKPIDVMEITPEVQKELDKQTKLAMDKVPEQKPKQTKEDCKYFYGGIGITFSMIGGAVENVYKGYPAHKAGIQSGDLVYGIDEDIRGEIGTPVRIAIVRGANVYERTLIREKICILLIEP